MRLLIFALLLPGFLFGQCAPLVVNPVTGLLDCVGPSVVGGTGLNSLNSQTGTSQTFGTPGTSGTSPNWNSASNVHTLNIPLASATGVTAGLVSKANYDDWQAKLGPSSIGVTVQAWDADLDVLAGLAKTANYVIGANSGGTAWEAKQLIAGANVTITHGTGTVTIAAGGASGYSTVADEGSALTQRATINFLGSGITCVDDAGNSRTNCTVSGGGGGGGGAVSNSFSSGATSVTVTDSFGTLDKVVLCLVGTDPDWQQFQPNTIQINLNSVVIGFNAAPSAGRCIVSAGGTGTGTGITSLNGLTAAIQTFVNDTNVTVTSTSSTHTLGWTGTLAVSRGGTGLSSGTSGGIPYFSGTGTLASSAALTANLPIVGGGAGGAPSSASKSGNTNEFGTVSGTKTSGKQLGFDASGNIIASAFDLGGGGSGVPYTTSTSDPSGACTPPTHHLNTFTQTYWICTVSGTWKEFLLSATSGTGVLALLEGTAPGAGANFGVHNVYFDASDSLLKSHENGGSVVTYYSTANPQVNITGNAATATALATNPTDCSSGQFATTIAANGNLTCAAITDADVPDTITVSNYLPLVGGTLTGQLIVSNQGIEFNESDTNPTCSSGNFNIFADLSENKLKKCQNGSITDLDTTGGTPDFSTLTGGTNTTAAMVVGAGATFTVNDNAFTVRDQTDTTKAVQFEVSGVSASTTRTLTVPNENTTIAGTDATQTLTNKTIDAEGTGNTITISQKISLPLVGCAGTTGSLLWDTLASNAPTATCSAGSTETTMMRGVADFPDSDGAYSVQLAFPLPDDWTGAVGVKFYWRAAATSGDVVWQAQTACRADGEVDDVAWNTANTVTDTTKGTANQLNTASISSLTTTGCAAGEILHLRVVRDRQHASDTITGVVSLGHVEVTLRRAI